MHCSKSFDKIYSIIYNDNSGIRSSEIIAASEVNMDFLLGLNSIGVMDIITSILFLLAGLGVFLFGLKAMGDNLETVAGSKMRKIFDKISGNRITGMLTGAGVTAVIQSSSATTVMVVGFVNAGVMTLTQAVPIIMGANIGTTITAQIVALESLNITAWLAAMTVVGSFMMLSKKDILKKVGAILAGLGMIFVGLDLMSTSMKTFQEVDSFKNFFSTTTNPFLLMAMGLAFTALIQSSSATSGILIVMASNNLIPLRMAMFVLLGVNIGTCITAVLASIGGTPNAKRAAVIHLLFNFAGAMIFLPIVYWVPLDTWLSGIFSGESTQIAMFHTIFNVTTTLLLIPFVRLLVFLSQKIIPEKKAVAGENAYVSNKLKYIDERLLSTPVIAINQAQKEIMLMTEIAGKNLDLAVKSIIAGKRIDNNLFVERENHLNFLNRELSSFLVKISATEVSFKDELLIASFYHVVSDTERIGDYAENIMEYSDELNKLGVTFSQFAIEEINDMYSKVSTVFENAIRAFETKDLELLSTVKKYEDMVDQCKETLGVEHIKRLNANLCTPAAGAVYLSLISNLERIADHMENIAISIKDYTAKPKKVQATAK